MATHREDLATIVTLEQGKPLAEGARRSRLWRELSSLVCRAGQAPLRRDHSLASAGQPAAGAARADRRRRGDHALEFPVRARGAQERGGARCRLSGRAQARAGNAVLGIGSCPFGPARRGPGRRFLRRPVEGPGVFGRRVRRSGCSQSHLHGIDRGWPQAHDRGRVADYPLVPRTGRPRAMPGVRRRRSRRSRCDCAVAAKFMSTGEDCLAINRILVHDSVYDAVLPICFAAEDSRRSRSATGFEDVDLGPLFDETVLDKCEAHVVDAVAKGARLLTGGCRHALGGLFYEPTALADVTTGMAIFHEETFGPVAAITRFRTEDGGGRPGQRFALWPSRLSLHARHEPILARCRSARIQHGGAEHLAHDRRAGSVRRHQAIRFGPRRRSSGDRGVHRAQIFLHRGPRPEHARQHGSTSA